MRQGNEKRNFKFKIKPTTVPPSPVVITLPSTKITVTPPERRTSFKFNSNDKKLRLSKDIMSLLSYIDNDGNVSSVKVDNVESSKKVEKVQMTKHKLVEEETPDSNDEKMNDEHEDPTESSQINELIREFLTSKKESS